MKTATRALLAFWVIAILSITAALFISAHYIEEARRCDLAGGNRVHATCQGVIP